MSYQLPDDDAQDQLPPTSKHGPVQYSDQGDPEVPYMEEQPYIEDTDVEVKKSPPPIKQYQIYEEKPQLKA